MDQQPANLAAALSAAGNPVQGQQEDPQARVLNFQFSIREATMILNKLNVATFNGFAEASQAMQIFAKVQATVANDKARVNSGGKTVAFKPPVDMGQTTSPKPSPTPEQETKTPEVNTAAPMSPVPPKTEAVSESSDEVEKKVNKDVPPPEDAGVFSVIDKRGDI